jgi:UDP-N-acetylglucosamine diphosphorylase/glucosamine-1-phosphate N-acetyltransferase
MRRIVFFEDSAAPLFSPLSLLRPVFELRCGHFTLRERILSYCTDVDWGAILRPELAETYRLKHPQAHVNDPGWLQAGQTLLINGRCLIDPAILDELEPGTACWMNDTLACLIVEGQDVPISAGPEAQEDLLNKARQSRPLQLAASPLTRPWSLIQQNPHWLEQDFKLRDRSENTHQLDGRVAIVGSADDVFIDSSASVDPFVVIDASGGPVWIDRKARVQAFTRIEGPAYIGPETQLFRANVREGCSFGPVCRVGGEVEESIMHGYANKYHDGFLGHAYVCPWVNLGALTTNSDLKNDYSEVSVPVAGISTPTGSTKVGCFIGDHTKTGLGSLFNTGSAIGVMCLILPGGELLPKHVPSFSWVWHGQLEFPSDSCDAGLKTARVAMSRRGQPLTPEMERLIRYVFEATAEERHRAAARKRNR